MASLYSQIEERIRNAQAELQTEIITNKVFAVNEENQRIFNRYED